MGITKLIRGTLIFSLALLTARPITASDPEDAAADAVASAFLQARQTAHLSKLERMGRNIFREKVCRRDRRFPSGLINDVAYETSSPIDLPQPAERLAALPDNGKTAARFGIGVCMLTSSPAQYSVLIATYESGWTSLWRIFWE